MNVTLSPDLPQAPNSSARAGEANSPAGELRRVRNGVALALLLKLVALFVLFFLFFAPSHGTRGAYDAFFQPVIPPISGH